VQYKNFEWFYYSTTNFDIYYYAGGGDYAKQTIDFLEEEFNRLTDLLGYAPYAKTKIFLYNSIHDLQQSNKGIEGATFTIGGRTDFIKLQMEVAHPGSVAKFKEELIYRLSRILIEDMMFGGSLAEIFQSSYLLNLPKWFIDGAARYLAYGWSIEMDDHIRDYLGHKRVKKLIKIEGDEAGIVGQSIWNYIALIYGKSNISNVLNLTRIIRNEENSIASTLGVDYKTFLSNWQNYYLLTEEEVLRDYKDPAGDDLLVSKRSNEFKYKNVRINPIGKRIAYSHNRLGKYKVYVRDMESGKTKTVLQGGIIVPGKKVDKELPLLDWIDDDNLGIIYYRRGRLYITSVNVQTGRKVNKPLSRFKQINSFSFNDNGRLAVISGDVDGQNDLFLVSMRRSAVRRITKDIFDDADPAFIPGTAAVVFSSNRPSDSLGVYNNMAVEDVPDNFNLFIYDLDTTRSTYYRLTNTLGNDLKPHPKNEYEIFYLSDQRGIRNLYKYDFRDSLHSQLTNYSKSIQSYDLHFDQDGMTFLTLDDGVDKVYYTKSVDFGAKQFTGQTPRQRYKQAQFVANRYTQRTGIDLTDAGTPDIPDDPDESIVPSDEEDLTDPDLIDTENFAFEDEEEAIEEQEGIIDTENFVFEGDSSPQQQERQDYRPDSFFSTYQRFQQETEVMGPIPYAPRFSFSNLVTSFSIDPLRGFGINLETQITDMLENHKVKGGALVITDLRSGDFFAEYEYLKYWVDFHFRVDNRLFSFRQDGGEQLGQRYSLTRFEPGVHLPISNWFRFELNPFFAIASFRNLQFEAVNTVNSRPDIAQDSRTHYGGVNMAAVFDNTVARGFNVLQGTRARAEFTQYGSFNGSNQNFGDLRLDVRHYQKVHKEITFATRLFYGQFLGPNKQNFLVGGVDNWLFNRTNSFQSGDPLEISNSRDNSDILFVEYVTNLRGFDYNELFGNSALVFNAEMRIPVFQYLSKGPLTSNFLRNFQLVGFYDIGTAWSGQIPLTRNASSNEIRFDNDPTFSASISNFRNPWLVGVGAGLRTVLLGYYAKFDVARPIRDFELGDYRFYVSIGLDF
ncbi:MAG: translocation protein TolB, partial [Bacteroidota bacterium]